MLGRDVVVTTDGYDHWCPRYGIGDDLAAQTEDFFDKSLADHFRGRAVRNDMAGTHRDEVVAVAGRVIEIVEHEHDRSSQLRPFNEPVSHAAARCASKISARR